MSIVTTICGDRMPRPNRRRSFDRAALDRVPLMWLLFLIGVSVVSPPAFPDGPQLATVSGSIDLRSPGIIPQSVDDDSLPPLYIHSIAGSALASDRVFSGLDIVANQVGQILFITDANSNPLGAAYVEDPTIDDLRITLHSLALGLIKINPLFWSLSSSNERDALRAATQHSHYPALLMLVGEIATRQARDLERHGYLEDDYLLEFGEAHAIASAIVSDVMNERRGSRQDNDSGPFIESRDRREIAIVNPMHIFLGVFFHRYLGEPPYIAAAPTPSDISLIRGRSGYFQLFPPKIVPPAKKVVEVDYGVYRVTYYRGFDGDDPRWLDWRTVQGKATWANFLKIVGLVFDVLGVVPGTELISAGAAYVLSDSAIEEILDSEALEELTDRVDIETLRRSETDELQWIQPLLDTLEIMIRSWNGIAEAIWGEAASDYRHVPEYWSAAGKFLKIWTVLQVANEGAPFFIDLARADARVSELIRHRSGLMMRIETLSEPMVVLRTAVVDGHIELDASGSRADLDGEGELMIRWDLDGDNAWDGPWTEEFLMRVTCEEPVQHDVRVQVRDRDGLIDSLSRSVVVKRMSPRATFAVGDVEDQKGRGYRVVMDAGGSSDNCSPKRGLLYRWDFDGDGEWDTEWMSEERGSWQYEKAGEFAVTVVVRDLAGETGSFSTEVSVR